jgi:hypothetical protein
MRRRTPSHHVMTPRVERHSYVDGQVAHRRGQYAQAIIIARKKGLKENQ